MKFARILRLLNFIESRLTETRNALYTVFINLLLGVSASIGILNIELIKPLRFGDEEPGSNAKYAKGAS